jgi:hypothetical protein
VYDDDGKDLIVYDGSRRDPALPLNIEKERPGKLMDFLYTPLLLLFVSSRALEVISQYNISNVTQHWLVIRDREGAVLDDSYVWLNCHCRAPLLDRTRADFEEFDGRVSKVRRFAVDEAGIPRDDLFLCAEPTLTVFSARLVEAVHAAKLTGARFEPLEQATFGVFTYSS